MTQQIPVIVITGAPGSGKNFVLKFLKRHFADLGYQVAVIRKLADHFIDRGKGPEKVGRISFQDYLLEALLNEERNAKYSLAGAPRPLIFVERGGMDGAAQVRREDIEAVWENHGRHYVHLRDERYKAVIQLAVNSEPSTAEDIRIRNIWMGTPHFAYIGMSNLKDKCLRTLEWVEHFLSGKEHETRHRLLVPFARSLLPLHAQPVEIMQYYALDESSPKPPRIRARGQDGYHVFTKGVKRKIGEMSSDDNDEPITGDDFASLQERRINEFATIVKTRWCFLARNGWYCELDVLRDLPDRTILEIEMPRPSWRNRIALPEGFDGIVEDVTGLSSYSNKASAKYLASQHQLAA